MLEWCYTVDLLDSSAMQAVTQGLRETQATFTQPWLVLALAVAAVLALYHGIVRRQVSRDARRGGADGGDDARRACG